MNYKYRNYQVDLPKELKMHLIIPNYLMVHFIYRASTNGYLLPEHFRS